MFGANRPAFGGAPQPFGSTSSPFGSQQQQQPGSTFGTNNAQSGFGGFGNAQSTTTNANPGGSLFGMSSNNNSSNSPFGKTVTGGANTSGSLFGGNALPSAGSSITGNAGSGTAIKPYVAYQEKDPTTGVMNVFQSISAMPEYRNFSLEELRMQDYQAGRKFTGTVSPFGAQNTNTNAGFGTIGNTNSTQPQSAGSGGLFGQRAGTAQNSPFGSLSSSNNTNNTNNSFGSGAFGANTNTNTGFGNTNNSPFGMNKPAAGGLFGQQPNQSATGGGFGQQNSTFGAANNAFGTTNTTGNSGGLFGQNTQQQGGGLFGNQQNNTFGQNNTQGGGLFGQNANTNTTGAFGQNTQPSGGLFGNKPAGGGLFGQQNNTFGSANTGGGGLFGQNNNNQQSGGLFGQNNTNQQSGGLFGQNNTNQTSGGLFGQNNNQQQQAGGGLFGQNNNQQGGLLGQNNATQSTFGQPQNNTNTGLFGNKPAGGGLFGQTQNNTGFGANRTTGGGMFGQNNTQNSQGMGGGLFGQNNQQQQSGGLFGQNNSQPQQGGLLGQNNQQQSGGLFGAKPAGTTGGLFGNNQTTQTGGGLFGNNQQQQQPQTGGLFGQNNQQQQQPSGLFGAKPATNTGGGLFGNSNNQTSLGQPSGGGLFGSKPAGGATTGGGLFGNNNTNTTTNTMGGGLFGNNNATNTGSNTSTGGGLFGAKPQGNTTGGLFGNNQANNNSTTTGGLSGGLFGSKPANSTNTLGGGLFGNNNSATSNSTSGGLFGNKPQTGTQQLGLQGGFGQAQQTQQQQQQQPATNPYGTNELFSRIAVPSSITQPTKPSATKVNADLKKKASLSSAYRLAPKPLFASRSLSVSPVNKSDKLLITDSRAASAGSVVDSANKDLTSSTSRAAVFSPETDEAILSADKLLFNPDRKSFKNLIINRKKMEEEADSANKQLHSEPRRITFTSSAAEGEKSVTGLANGGESHLFDQVHESPTVSKDVKNKARANNTLSSSPSLQPQEVQPKEANQSMPRGIIGDDISFTDDGYYISPSLDTLASKTLPQLRKVSGLVIGHKDYGKIEFLEPVDLSNIPLPLLCGKIICFEPRACIAYPNSTSPPAEGEGINVRARISLYKCYPSDKATREPIKDATHQLVKKHIEKMKRQKQAKFESYDPVTGCWTFVVQHPAH